MWQDTTYIGANGTSVAWTHNKMLFRDAHFDDSLTELLNLFRFKFGFGNIKLQDESSRPLTYFKYLHVELLSEKQIQTICL